MDQDQVALQLRNYFASDHSRRGMSLTNTTKLLDDWFLDSLAIVETVVFMEKAFGIKFSSADINGSTFESIDTLSKLVLSRLKTREK